MLCRNRWKIAGGTSSSHSDFECNVTLEPSFFSFCQYVVFYKIWRLFFFRSYELQLKGMVRNILKCAKMKSRWWWKKKKHEEICIKRFNCTRMKIERETITNWNRIKPIDDNDGVKKNKNTHIIYVEMLQHMIHDRQRKKERKVGGERVWALKRKRKKKKTQLLICVYLHGSSRLSKPRVSVCKNAVGQCV